MLNPLRPVDVFGVHSGVGGHVGGAELGPDALKASGLPDWLRAAGIDPTWRDIDADHAGRAPLDRVVEVCRALAAGVERTVAAGRFALTLGGDHSCAVGTWSGAANALRADGPLGLVWIDAHMDSHIPETSPSSNLHGMPVAHLLGHGELALTSIARRGAAVLPDKLCILGVRSFEPEEPALLDALGVRVIAMEEVRARGLDDALDEALRIAADGTAGHGISLDLDALDPVDVPGTGSPVTGGIAGADMVAALRGLARRPGLVGLEIAELNPTLDRDGATVTLVHEMIEALFGEAGT